MGIGKEEFEKHCHSAINNFSSDADWDVLKEGNVYINKQFGIIFNKPENWDFVDNDGVEASKDAQILASEDEELNIEIIDEMEMPECMITKYAGDKEEYNGVFSPTITFNATPKEVFEELGCESIEEVIKMTEEGTTQILKDFKVVKRFEPYLLNNHLFYEFDTEYLFENKDIEQSVTVELKVLKTEHNGYYYDFNMHQSAEQGQTAAEEFELFKQSIKLV